MLTIVRAPNVSQHPARPTIGLRFSAPYRGMFSVVDDKMKELQRFLKTSALAPQGAFFLRYHVIDMAGTMELEVGVLGSYALPAGSEVSADVFPAGRYASLVYQGLGLPANKLLLGWIEENGHQKQRHSTPAGDAFGCRYEAYLTDPAVEPRKKRWEIELSIQLVD